MLLSREMTRTIGKEVEVIKKKWGEVLSLGSCFFYSSRLWNPKEYAYELKITMETLDKTDIQGDHNHGIKASIMVIGSFVHGGLGPLTLGLKANI